MDERVLTPSRAGRVGGRAGPSRGISGEKLPLPEWALPEVVIAIGVVILLRGLLQRGEPDGA